MSRKEREMLKKADHTHSNLLTQFFEGECEAHGLIIDRFGKVRQRIHVIMRGYWEDQAFRLNETFTYQDGRIEQRFWRVELNCDGTFSAVSGDLKTPATGVADPNYVKMAYEFLVPIGSREFRLKFDDRMYRINDTVLYERAAMKKFGILVAEIILTFHKKK